MQEPDIILFFKVSTKQSSLLMWRGLVVVVWNQAIDKRNGWKFHWLPLLLRLNFIWLMIRSFTFRWSEAMTWIRWKGRTCSLWKTSLILADRWRNCSQHCKGINPSQWKLHPSSWRDERGVQDTDRITWGSRSQTFGSLDMEGLIIMSISVIWTTLWCWVKRGSRSMPNDFIENTGERYWGDSLGNLCTDIRSFGFSINIWFLNLLLGETHSDAQKCMNGESIPHAIYTVHFIEY